MEAKHFFFLIQLKLQCISNLFLFDKLKNGLNPSLLSFLMICCSLF